MKIAIRSKDGKSVSDSITSFAGYLVYELAGETVVKSEFRKCKPAHIGDSNNIRDCEAVISKAFSADEKAFLKKNGKEVLMTFKTSPEDAIRSFIRQKYFTGSFAH